MADSGTILMTDPTGTILMTDPTDTILMTDPVSTVEIDVVVANFLYLEPEPA